MLTVDCSMFPPITQDTHGHLARVIHAHRSGVSAERRHINFCLLLRNSCRKCGCRNELEAHGFGGSLQCLEPSGLELFFVCLQSLEDVGLTVLNESVDNPG